MVNGFKEKVEKCLERIAVKNANSTSSLCFYEPDVPMLLKDVVQEKNTKTESSTQIMYHFAYSNLIFLVMMRLLM